MEKEIWQKIILAGRNCFINGINSQIVNEFIDQVADINPTVFNESTGEHLRLTAMYAKKFAEKLRDAGVEIDVEKAEILGLIHDAGRMFTHRKGRNEAVEAVLLRKIGFSEELLKDLYPDTLFAPEGLEKMTDLDTAKKIMTNSELIKQNPYWACVLTADLLAKSEKGKLRRWEQVFEKGHFSDKYIEAPVMWPSEKR